MNTVSLVIPGRNCAATIRQCLESVVPLLSGQYLREIIFVDDGSTDATADIVSEFPVRCLTGLGQGPGSARNLGWQAAEHPLVWFVDADCVSHPDALDLLHPQLEESQVGGVSGSYGNMNPDSLLSCLIHEEIIERHRGMSRRVDFLATFNVLYRRDLLEKLNGFDVRYLKGQDAELSWRVMKEGYELRFVFESHVNHYHETRWLDYLSTQRKQGYWRVFLHLRHRGHELGDSYSRISDHVQPPLAMLLLVTSPLAMFDAFGWTPMVVGIMLGLAQIPMTWQMVRRLGKIRYVMFAGMSFLRSFWRGLGMSHGVISYFFVSKLEKPPS